MLNVDLVTNPGLNSWSHIPYVCRVKKIKNSEIGLRCIFEDACSRRQKIMQVNLNQNNESFIFKYTSAIICTFFFYKHWTISGKFLT